VAWPPDLARLKADLDITDSRDDVVLGEQLAAAVGFVERVHEGRYDFDPLNVPGLPPLSGLPVPGAEMELGTIRLAGRWYSRRRSPDGVVAMGDVGTNTIPGFDSDIERMLEMGRYGGSVIV
jgi:hypothetical protein